jgi:hypothetical protein
MLKNHQRIVGVILLVVFAVLDSLAQQGILAAEHADLIREIVVVALPLLGVGALVDVLNTERRRRDPSIPALKDDVLDGATSDPKDGAA